MNTINRQFQHLRISLQLCQQFLRALTDGRIFVIGCQFACAEHLVTRWADAKRAD
jgi:hypothetical protein